MGSNLFKFVLKDKTLPHLQLYNFRMLVYKNLQQITTESSDLESSSDASFVLSNGGMWESPPSKTNRDKLITWYKFSDTDETSSTE